MRSLSSRFFLFFFLIPPGLFALEGPVIGSRAAALLDGATLTILYGKNMDELIPPASLTKLMTIHLALKRAAVEKNLLDEPEDVPPAAWAVNQPPRSSLMFLGPGQRVTLRELLLGLAIPSGNDAAVAVALRFAPTVEDFAQEMTGEARAFGMEKTIFVEPSGVSERNLTTAREFALFCARYLALHPQALRDYHSVPEFAYPQAENVGPAYREKPGTILQYNRNPLLGRVDGVDGLKTGYIDEAGYNMALSARRGDTRFIAVLLGAPAQTGGDKVREQDSRNILAWAFENFRTIRPPEVEIPPVRVWKGRADQVNAVAGERLVFTAPVDRTAWISWRVEPVVPLVAPLAQGEKAGDLVFFDSKGELKRIPLLTAAAVETGSLFKQLWDGIRLYFWKPNG